MKPPRVIQLKDLIKRAASKEEKFQHWEELKKEGTSYAVFVQTFLNIYTCEVYKCAYLISTHLIARLGVEGQNTTGLTDLFEEVHRNIRHNPALHRFITDRIGPVIETHPLSELLSAGQLPSLFSSLHTPLDTVTRPPSGPRYELLDLSLPSEAGTSLSQRNVYTQFLTYFFAEETQEEIRFRALKLLEKVLGSIVAKVKNDGKNVTTRTKLEDWKGLEMAHLVSFLEKQEVTAVWEANEVLGRKVFYEL